MNKIFIFLILLSNALISQTITSNKTLDKLGNLAVKQKKSVSTNEKRCSNNSRYWLGNSGKTSYDDYALYVPKDNQDIIYININFIVLQYSKQDPRNFSEDNTQHLQYLNKIVDEMNYRISHFNQYNAEATCEAIDIFDSKIQFIPQFYFIANKKLWDYTNYNYTGIIESKEITALVEDLTQLPNYQQGINIYLSNNGNAYKDLIKNYTNESYGAYNEKFSKFVLYGNNWARSPSVKNLEKQPRVIWGNAFIKYNTLLWYFADYKKNNRKDVYGWLLEVSSSLIHEIGHNFGLSHTSEQYKTRYQSPSHKCYENFMSQKYGPKKQLFDKRQLGKIYRNLSNSSARNAVSKHAFNGTTRKITSKEIWDIDTRLYSNIVIEKGAELKITCNVMMPPQAFILIKKGGTLIINGGQIVSADNTLFKGILRHKNKGTFHVLSDSLTSNENFINYHISSINSKLEKIILNTTSQKRQSIYQAKKITPNPFAKSFIIEFIDQITANITIYDLKGKVVYTDNIRAKEKEIYLEKVPVGIYFLKVTSKNISKVYKIVKS